MALTPLSPMAPRERMSVRVVRFLYSIAPILCASFGASDDPRSSTSLGLNLQSFPIGLRWRLPSLATGLEIGLPPLSLSVPLRKPPKLSEMTVSLENASFI